MKNNYLNDWEDPMKAFEESQKAFDEKYSSNEIVNENDLLRKKIAELERKLQLKENLISSLQNRLHQTEEPLVSREEGLKITRKWIDQHIDELQTQAEKPDRANEVWQNYTEYERDVVDGKVVAYRDVVIDRELLSRKLYGQYKRFHENKMTKSLQDFLTRNIYRTDLFLNKEQRNLAYLFQRLNNDRPDIYDKIISIIHQSPEDVIWNYEKHGVNSYTYTYGSIILHVNITHDVGVNGNDTQVYEFDLEVI